MRGEAAAKIQIEGIIIVTMILSLQNVKTNAK